MVQITITGNHIKFIPLFVLSINLTSVYWLQEMFCSCPDFKNQMIHFLIMYFQNKILGKKD